MSPDPIALYHIVETDARLFADPYSTHRFRRRAEASARAGNKARITPSFSLRVVRRGFMRYDVVAFQNRLEPSA